MLFLQKAHSTEHPSRGCPHLVLILTADSTEAMRIKCLTQGHNILMPGFKQSTSASRNRHTYKIAFLCYHCHSSTAPSYVTGMLHRKPLHTRNTRSSSYTMPLLNRPAHSKATLGDRSFSFASSSVWNSIPNDVRCAPSLSPIKSRLKTYLFHSVYKD